MKLTATYLIDICDRLEGKQIKDWRNLSTVMHNIIGMEYSTMDVSMKKVLMTRVKEMMIIEHNQLLYKEF